MTKINSYYLGLDMGTSSVGWAVTDAKYNILRAKGKDLWGIREFDEASTAVDRRSHRIARRRRQREIVMRGMLRLYFHDEIAKVDPYFYQRLENSKYHLEDKDEAVRTPNGIFHDECFNDKDYFEKYPTIFHLRKALIDNESDAFDVRLLYLALLNMFKHRGHFINATEDINNINDDTRDMSALYNELQECLNDCGLYRETGADDLYGQSVLPEIVDITEFRKVLGSREYSRTEKQKKICELLEIDPKNKTAVELIKGMCGLKINLVTIFGEKAVDSEGKKLEISFTDSSVDEKLDLIEEVSSAEETELVHALKSIYDNAVLDGVLNGSKYLSYSRVKDYEKHGADLKLLKKLLKKNVPEKYEEIFRGYGDGSYSAYVGSVNAGEKNRRNIKGRSRTDLYTKLKKILNDKDFPDSPEKAYILKEIDTEQFLPKQLEASNGVIPNQVHAREMKAILSNAEKHLPFLLEKDEYSQTVSERILKLFTFTIPYYIGPTSEKSAKDGGTGWVVRKEAGKVLPWNLSSKIDIAATREGFIERLIRSCTYLSDEKVLPKSSLLYERYCVLNEINNIRIDGEKIPVELKQDIYSAF